MNDSLSRQETVSNVLENTRLDIIIGKYEAREMLSESKISQQFQVSRSSVRTAFQTLEQEGLLETLPNGRKVVKHVGAKYVEDMCLTRSALECEAARIILAKPNPDFSQMWFILGKMHAAVHQTDVNQGKSQFQQCNDLFHGQFFEIADNAPLKQCWKTISPVISAIVGMNTSLDVNYYAHDHYASHYMMANLLANRDEKVIEYIRDHAVNVTLKDALRAMENAKRSNRE